MDMGFKMNTYIRAASAASRGYLQLFLLIAIGFSSQFVSAQEFQIGNVTVNPPGPFEVGDTATFSLTLTNTSTATTLLRKASKRNLAKGNSANKSNATISSIPISIITDGPLTMIDDAWDISSVSSNISPSTADCSELSSGSEFSCTQLLTGEEITVTFESITLDDAGAYNFNVGSSSSDCSGTCTFSRNFAVNAPTPTASLSVANSVAEDNGPLIVTVSLDHPVSAGLASVDFSTTTGSADGSDFTETSGTIVFSSSGLPSMLGSATATPISPQAIQIEIPINDDGLTEGRENFRVGLSVSSTDNFNLPVAIGSASVFVGIIDDETPTATMTAPSSINEANGPLLARVSLSFLPDSSAGVTVIAFPGTPNPVSLADYEDKQVMVAFDDNGPVPSSDYSIVNSTTVDIAFGITNDSEAEPNENLVIFMDVSEQAFGVNGSDTSANVLIIDDDSSATPIASLNVASSIDEADGPLLATVSINALPSDAANLEISSAPAVSSSASGDDFEQKSVIVQFNSSGAVSSSDYQIVNSTTVRVPFDIVDDSLQEPEERLNISFTDSNSIDISTNSNSQDVSILDNDGPPVVSVSALSSVNESAGSILATVEIDKVPDDTSSVEITSAAGSNPAASSDDFEEKTVIINFNNSGLVAGTGYSILSPTSAQVSFNIVDDTVIEDDEIFDIFLESEVGLVLSNSNSSQAVTIVDNDAPPETTAAPSISASSQRSFSEDSGRALITFSRNGDDSDAISFDFATVESRALKRSPAISSDGMAIAPDDYTSTSTTVSWAAGDSSNKSVSIPIIDDNLFEGDETFRANTSNLSSGASFNFDPALVITIVENDAEPGGELNFSAASYDISEDGGSATITVTRSGGGNGAVSVNYSSSDDSATAGEDYSATAGSLSWATGDTSNKTFNIPVNSDILNEDTERVLLELSSPSGTAVLGSQANSILNILNINEIGAPTISKDDISVTDFDGDGLVDVVLDATGKIVSDNPIDDVTWIKDGQNIANGMVTSAKLPIGTHPLRVIATDNNGKRAAVDFIAEVKELNPDATRMLGDTPGLNNEQGTVAGALDDLCPRLSELGQQNNLTTGQGNLRQRCEQLRDPDLSDEDIVDALDQIAGEEAEAIIITAARFTNMHHTNLRNRFTQLRRGGKALIDVSGIRLKFDGGSLNGQQFVSLGQDILGGAASGDEEAEAEIFVNSRLGLFVNGNISYGERDPTKNNSGFKLDIEGITAGMDYRFSDSFIGGVAVGYSNSDLDYANDGGVLKGSSTFYSAYTSYYNAANYYIDSSITYADSDFDVTRHIKYRDMSGLVDLRRSGNTNGEQLLATLDFGWDYNNGPWTFGPNGSLSYSDTSIDGYAERGDSGLELEYSGQDNITSTLGLGFHGSRVFLTDWGVLIANITGTYYREFKNQNGIMRARFVHDPFKFDADNPTRDMLIISDIPDRNYLSLGIGLAAQFKYGLSGFIDYQSQFMTDDVTSRELAFGLRYEARF